MYVYVYVHVDLVGSVYCILATIHVYAYMSVYLYTCHWLCVCVLCWVSVCVCVLGYVFLTRCTHEWCPYLVLEVISSHTSPSLGGGGGGGHTNCS